MTEPRDAAAATMSLHTKAMEAEARAAKGKQMKVITVEKLLEETDLKHLACKFEEADVDDLSLRGVIVALNEDKEEGNLELEALLDRLSLGGGANARIKRFFANPGAKKEGGKDGGKRNDQGKGSAKSGKGGGKGGKSDGKKKKEGESADEPKKAGGLEKKKCPACGKKSTGVGTKKGCQNCKDIMLGKKK